MRKVLGQAAIALVLFAVGYVQLERGQLQNRVADAHEELAMLALQRGRRRATPISKRRWAT